MTAPESVRLDPYVIETLLPDLVGHDRRASALLVYLVIAAATEGRLTASHAQLAERTGLSRRSAQAAVAHLARRGLIEIRRRGPTEACFYRALTPWRR
jgi:CRP-like cAMP-binding protein